MAYLADIVDLCRRGVGYMNRILGGTRPSDLSIEQPSRFELHVNSATAGAIGLTIPADVAAHVTGWFP